MADNSAKLAQIIELIEAGKYFIINRPRQYGKTTILNLIADHIQKRADYIVLPLSFEGIGDLDFKSESAFCKELMALILDNLFFIDKEVFEKVTVLAQSVDRLTAFSRAITSLVRITNKKIVLLVDEVDQSSKHEIFLKFLGMLRNKFIQTQQGRDLTFHNVILVGVHDIKMLKLKIRTDNETRLNSPWNIAAEFKIDIGFSAKEIMPMLEDYTNLTGIQMNVPIIAQEIFNYTSGYPFLISKICKVIDEDILPQKKEATWTLHDIEQAIRLILPEENFNFDSLIKNLENNPSLYETVHAILLENKWLSYNIHNPIVKLGVTYGIFKTDPSHNRLQIHNKIYQQIIYNYMVSKIETDSSMNHYQSTGQFYLTESILDMNTILLKFQTFMKEHHSDKDVKFLEREGRLIFLAFLKPIINGKGHTFVEVEISEEKRLDVVITYYQNKYIVELKIWYSDKAHERGLAQLTDYLERQNHHKGWLLIFDHRKKKTWKTQVVQNDGKDIFAVWV